MGEVEKKLQREIDRIRSKKWNHVATHMAELLQMRKYTSTACRDRYEGITDGTALKPIELDSDQEGRAHMRNTRIAANKRARAEAANNLVKELEAKKGKRAAMQAAKERAQADRTTRSSELKAVRTAFAHMKNEALEQRVLKKTNKTQWAAYSKAETKWSKDKARLQRALLNKLLGLHPNARPLMRKRPVEEREAEFSGDETSEDEMPELDDDEENDGDAETSEDESTDDEIIVVAPRVTKHKRDSISGSDNPAPQKKTTACSTASRRSVGKGKSSSPRPEHIQPGKAVPSRETLLNPRSIMTREELDVLLFTRKLPKATSREKHCEIIARLVQEDDMLTHLELDDLLDEAQEKRTGNKADKIFRLQVHDAENSAAGSKGIVAGSAAFKATYEGYSDVGIAA